VSLRIGIDLGGTKIEGIVLDGSGEAARLRVDTPRGDYAATLGAMAALVDALERQTGTGATIGIGIPGTISPSTGLVKNANSAWLIGHPLQTDLEQLLARPVRIANDANCFAISEATDGAGEGAEVVFGVIIGTGVGGGITVKGRIVSGPNGIAGEWGHNPLPWPDGEDNQRLCYCGKQACIETFLSGPGFSADHGAVAGVQLNPTQIVEAADRGDAAAEHTLRRYERRMARALASIINVLDPDVIVLGGGMSNIARLYRHVPKLWNEFIFSCGASLSGSPRRANQPSRFALRRSAEALTEAEGAAPHRTEIARTTLVRAKHGATSGVRGAAWLWPDTSDAQPSR
jgi:fructokinase